MPYRADPKSLRPTPRLQQILAAWQAEHQDRHTLPGGVELAQWWLEKLDTDASDCPWGCGLPTEKWRRLARHVHLYAYIVEPERIDDVGDMLGIEHDNIPEPKVEYWPDGFLKSISWSTSTYGLSFAPNGLETWRLPLACVGYQRPAWRDEPARRAPPGVKISSNWWV